MGHREHVPGGDEELRQRERLLRAMVDNALDAIGLTQLGTHIRVNPAYAAMFGYDSPDQLIGVPFQSLVAPEDHARVAGFIRERARGGPAPEFYEVEAVRRNATRFRMEVHASPYVRDQQPYTLLVLRDVTDSRRMEDRLRQAQKMEAVGQLAGGVAHDFNNVLASMMLHLGLIEQDPTLASGVRKTVREVLREAQRAATLTRQLLMFSRRSVMDVHSLDLNEVVANLLKMLGRLIGEHVSLRFDRGDEVPAVRGDAGMLEQVLMNLAVNARDAMPDGGRLTISTAAVTVRASDALANPDARPGEFVCLTVADTGCGMDEATLRRIFEPFFTTKERGKGTGLGLATVHGIVAQHNGWIDAHSEPGRGSRFDVFLPVDAQAGTQIPEAPSAPAIRGTETILLVEDAEGLRMATASALQRLGYRVLEAGNGPDALDIWNVHRADIDLVFSDVVLPQGMNGIRLVAQLRADAPALKCVLASGYSAELADGGTAALAGVKYVAKPYRIEELSRVIRDCLDQQ